MQIFGEDQKILSSHQKKGILIMGILNCSADSMHNGSTDIKEILTQAEKMIDEGVDILDIGAEATNPSIKIQVSSDEKATLQCERVLPIIEAIKKRFDVKMSVDTSEPLVMREAINRGVDLINDQRSLQLPGALAVVVETGVPVILMHSYLLKNRSSLDEPIVMRVKREWLAQFRSLTEQGLKPEQVILDPGFGQGNYGKNLKENTDLLAGLGELVLLGYPVLVGWSRKSMIADLVGGCTVSDRLPGSLAAAVIAMQKGACILRVHDVAQTLQALAVARATA